MTADSTPAARPVTLVSIRVITDDVARLADFYQELTAVPARWFTPDFAELNTPVGTLAIGSVRTVALFGEGTAAPAANRSVIVEFLVDDVDAVHDRLAAAGTPVVQEPTTMPWGNRSLLLRDPDGNLVNVFTPVTEAAIAKFAR
ncbi:Glyoxalase/Bleomycin resistance protein/Dioxygenase superfamily protein [Jatrophihabitans endophyticus]|uniref:Glyoxalase/Bleomycin resistance protein/Dioxygenase superfamily protein n=1 Tax=Jatrophihabitans endophyticus TaxID=1206085 RepID=A0A1M5RL48_9ACTN|nr:VOC family protein [Jatrophihabitans endophyticus]SHH26798.1 Glyoxalase/Bleomycin resistance protein/Dioxygenase superfamily protein [Jatrophihabitans endophyticus]